MFSDYSGKFLIKIHRTRFYGNACWLNHFNFLENEKILPLNIEALNWKVAGDIFLLKNHKHIPTKNCHCSLKILVVPRDTIPCSNCVQVRNHMTTLLVPFDIFSLAERRVKGTGLQPSSGVSSFNIVIVGKIHWKKEQKEDQSVIFLLFCSRTALMSKKFTYVNRWVKLTVHCSTVFLIRLPNKNKYSR